MWRSLHDTWWRLTTTPPSSFADHLLSGLLRGGALLYGAAVAARNRAYDRGWVRQARLPCPVISIGNLSLGGTGKTTCVESLATRLLQRGLRVCILSRGYGGKARRPYWLLHRQGRLLVNGQPAATRDGLPDEPQLLAWHLSGVPVVIGAAREQTGRLACEEFQPAALILDDGFQHRRLFRDLDLVLVNARMPLSGWPIFPHGPMREPLASLSRAQVIVVTKVDQSRELVAALQERLRMINPDALIATAMHEPDTLQDLAGEMPVPLDRLTGMSVSLVSSIGDPDGFEQTVRQLGSSVVSHAVYPDHHAYSRRDWDEVVQGACAAGAQALVTTEKDAVRLSPFKDVAASAALPVWVLRVRMRFLSGESELDARLAGVCAR